MNRVRLTYLVAVVLALGIVAIGFVVGITPLLATARTAATERAAIDAENEALALRLLELQEAQDEIGTHEETLDELRQKVPTDAAADAYIEQLSRLAERAGVALDLVTLGDAVPHGGSAAAVPAETAAPTDPAAPAEGAAAPTDPAAPAEGAAAPPASAGLLMVPVQIGVIGSGEGVRRFIREVQDGDRYTLVTKLSLNSSEGAGDVLSAEATALLDGFVWVLPE